MLAMSGNNLLHYTSKILKTRKYTLKKAILLQFDDDKEGETYYQTLWKQIQKLNDDYDNDNSILNTYKEEYPIICNIYEKMRKHEKEVMLYLYMLILGDYDPFTIENIRPYNRKFRL